MSYKVSALIMLISSAGLMIMRDESWETFFIGSLLLLVCNEVKSGRVVIKHTHYKTRDSDD